ncbi:MAG: ABC transporter permease subunit [bacterium]|jgi:ABC-type transport system involved in multi-copper enzyme maturation permease subunit
MLPRLGILVIKEFRQKARGLSTIGILVFMLAVIALVSYFVLIQGYVSIENGYSSASDIGRNLAVGVLFSQLILTAVFGLTFNGSAITQERDRETIDLMNLTLLSNAEIVSGKLASSILFILLLLFAGLPFFALSYTFGGWEISELGAAILVEFALVFLVSAIGLLISVSSKDTRAALGRTFTTLIFGTVGTLYFGIRFLSPSQYGSVISESLHTVLGIASVYLNPGFALYYVLFPGTSSLQSAAATALLSVKGYPFWLQAVTIQCLIALLATLLAVVNYGKIRMGLR